MTNPTSASLHYLRTELTSNAGSIAQGSLSSGGPGDTYSSMEERVARLETHFEYVRKDLDEIRADQKVVLDRLSALATKKDLESWRWQWLATGIAIIALTVGGITGGLALIARFAGG